MKLGFIYAGQGTQYVGMGQSFYENDEDCKNLLDNVKLDFELTYDVEHWCKENGFEVVSCEGDGSDGRYEPKFQQRLVDVLEKRFFSRKISEK